MPQRFRHLQYDERCRIHAWHQREASVSAIAAQLRCRKFTVRRELRCNASPSGYCHRQAQQLPQQCRHKAVTGAPRLHQRPGAARSAAVRREPPVLDSSLSASRHSNATLP